MKKPAAAVTIVLNEPFFLRIWCNYYCTRFPEEDTYVIGDPSDSSIIAAKSLFPKLNVVYIPQNDTVFDVSCNKAAVESTQHKLLETYNVVVTGDSDEYLIPSPSLGCKDIHDLCVKFAEGSVKSDKQYIKANGYSVLHQIDSEKPIDLSSTDPLLIDRSGMWAVNGYSKTHLSKVPLHWSAGFHHVVTPDRKARLNSPTDPDLDLFHAWHVDYELISEELRSGDRKGVDESWWTSDREKLKTFFRTRKSVWTTRGSSYRGDIKRVPEHWKRLFYYRLPG